MNCKITILKKKLIQLTMIVIESLVLLPEHHKELSGVKISISPTGTVTSKYGSIEAVRDFKPHRGIDFACGTGDPIHSLTDGVVVKITDASITSLGNGVFIRTAQGYQFIYGHASKILVSLGEKIHKGDVIAKCGSTGHSTGSHLHFGALDKLGHYIDPKEALEQLRSILGAIIN